MPPKIIRVNLSTYFDAALAVGKMLHRQFYREMQSIPLMWWVIVAIMKLPDAKALAENRQQFDMFLTDCIGISWPLRVFVRTLDKQASIHFNEICLPYWPWISPATCLKYSVDEHVRREHSYRHMLIDPRIGFREYICTKSCQFSCSMKTVLMDGCSRLPTLEAMNLNVITNFLTPWLITQPFMKNLNYNKRLVISFLIGDDEAKAQVNNDVSMKCVAPNKKELANVARKAKKEAKDAKKARVV